MTTYTCTLIIECETAEQAQTVIGERLGFDEDYGFEYTINAGDNLWPKS